MIRISFCLAGMVPLLLALGCGGGSTGPDGGSGGLLPMTVGNSWEYSVAGYEVIEGDTAAITGQICDQVVRATSHTQGFELYEVVEIADISNQAGPDTSSNYIAFYGGQVRAYDDTTSSEHVVMIQYPLEYGNTWLYDPSDSTMVVTVMDIDAYVSVPAGSFSGCAYLQKTDQDSPSDYEDTYLAPDVGRARMVDHGEGATYTEHLVIELESYQVE